MMYYQEECGFRVYGVSYDEIEAKTKLKDGNIYGKDVEQFDDISPFISFGEFGDRVPKETRRAKQIRQWFHRHFPEARLSWEVIETNR